METPVHVLLIIDASGSMHPRARDVRGGFNSYIEALREDKASTYRVSAATFNTIVTPLFTDLDLDDVPELDCTTYRPNGGTALFDAVGVSVNLLTKKVGSKETPYGTDRVICVIMTDGEENSSTTFTKSVIQGKIARRTKAGNWTFVYLGADQDAWKYAQDLGIGYGNTVAYTGDQTRSTYNSLATGTVAVSHSGQTSSQSFATDMGFQPPTSTSSVPPFASFHPEQQGAEQPESNDADDQGESE